MTQHEPIRIAVIGMGNCGSSLCQLVHGKTPSEVDRFEGVFWPLRDPRATGERFEIVAAFDVDATKVGVDLSRAIRSPSNCTTIYRELAPSPVVVARGPCLDGLDGALGATVEVSGAPAVDVAAALRASRADVAVNMLPTGSLRATELYAQAAIDAGCGFVNCIPIPIATSPAWQARFARAGLPVLGDDMKSQLGTTAFHQAIIDLIQQKGGRIAKTYQMNIGGNSDFLNMTTESRRAYKNRTKTSAVQSRVRGLKIPDIGPNGFVPELRDNKRAHVFVEATAALGMKISLNFDLSVEDSPNAAGVILPAVLACHDARRRGVAGALPEVSELFFKLPLPEEVYARGAASPAPTVAAQPATARLEAGPVKAARRLVASTSR
jgi:myo-inositol-1-phosphate synthase